MIGLLQRWREWRAERLRRRREDYERRFLNLQGMYPWAPEWLIHQCLSNVMAVRAEGWEALEQRAAVRRLVDRMKEGEREAHP